MNIVAHPTLSTLWPWSPPLPPFHWRLANFGPVKIEILYDDGGRQVFRHSTAIKGRTVPNKGWKAGGAS